MPDHEQISLLARGLADVDVLLDVSAARADEVVIRAPLRGDPDDARVGAVEGHDRIRVGRLRPAQAARRRGGDEALRRDDFFSKPSAGRRPQQVRLRAEIELEVLDANRYRHARIQIDGRLIAREGVPGEGVDDPLAVDPDANAVVGLRDDLVGASHDWNERPCPSRRELRAADRGGGRSNLPALIEGRLDALERQIHVLEVVLRAKAVHGGRRARGVRRSGGGVIGARPSGRGGVSRGRSFGARRVVAGAANRHDTEKSMIPPCEQSSCRRSGAGFAADSAGSPLPGSRAGASLREGPRHARTRGPRRCVSRQGVSCGGSSGPQRP